MPTLVANPIFGRQREIDAIQSALDRTTLGRSSHVVLIGEPGIGKTRLVSEAIDRAQHLGYTVSTGHCIERSGVPSFWPWIQVCRVLLSAVEDGSKLSSDLTTLLDQMRGETKSDASPEPYLIAERITDLFVASATVNPVLVVLEDVHWADTPSLVVLEALVGLLQGSRVALAVTSRDLDPRHSVGLETVLEITRRPEVVRIDLGPLPDDDLTRLVQARVETSVDHEFVSSIVKKSAGNPLFATQLASGAAQTKRGDLELPSTLQRTLARRFRGLSTECKHLLLIAAVIGDEFSFKRLSDAARLLRNPIGRDLLDEAASGGVIIDPEQRGIRYRFVHTLVREALRLDATPSSVQQAHRAVADVLERDDGAESAARIAYHLQASGPYGELERLVAHSMEAGRRSVRVNDVEETLLHFGRVLDAKNGQEDDDWAEAALGFGKATMHVGYADPNEESRGFDLVEEVFEYYLATKRQHKAVAIMAGNLPSRLWIIDRLLTLTERSLELVEPGTETEAYLLVRLGYALGCSTRQDYAGAERSFQAAESYAKKTENLEIRSRVFQSRILLESRQANWQAMTRYALEVIGGPEDRTRNTKSSGYQGAVHGLLAVGDSKMAAKLTTEAVELAERMLEPESIRTAAVNTHNVAVLTGDKRLMETHLRYSNRIFTRSAWPSYRYALFDLMMGDPDSAVRELSAVREDPALHGHQVMNLARVRWTLARASHITLDPSWASAAASIHWTEINMPFGIDRSWALTDCLIAYFTEDKDGAADAYRRLETSSGQADSGLWSHPCAIDGVLALAALTMNQPTKAETHWDTGIKLCADAAYLPDLFLILRDRALELMTTTSRENLRASKELIDRANQIATELEFNVETTGLRTLNNAYSRMTSRVKTTAQFGLSNRELEVLKLVSNGKTNQQIAETLTISPYTVAEHVSNILLKTGSANRTQAGKFAAMNDLC